MNTDKTRNSDLQLIIGLNGYGKPYRLSLVNFPKIEGKELSEGDIYYIMMSLQNEINKRDPEYRLPGFQIKMMLLENL